MSNNEEQWREKLSDEQFHVLRQCGTEPAFTGQYWDLKDDGMYHCAGCDATLFSSETKFDSGTGWPSFTDPVVATTLKMREDRSHGMSRIEVLCAGCDGHLGHVFPDGPGESGMRFCINSAALDFKSAS